MSVNITASINRTTNSPLDSSSIFNTVSDLKGYKLPYDGQISFVKSTNTLYFYDSSNPDDAVTGKWRKIDHKVNDKIDHLKSNTVETYIGAGRPDKPATTQGKIKGNEQDGCIYTSTDGAGVKAWQWTKVGGKWKVTNGDTGWVTFKKAKNLKPGAKISFRRVNDMVTVLLGGRSWNLFNYYVVGENGHDGNDTGRNRTVIITTYDSIPDGFVPGSPIVQPIYYDNGAGIDHWHDVYIGDRGDSKYMCIYYKKENKHLKSNPGDMRVSQIMYLAEDLIAWPDTLDI